MNRAPATFILLYFEVCDVFLADSTILFQKIRSNLQDSSQRFRKFLFSSLVHLLSPLEHFRVNLQTWKES